MGELAESGKAQLYRWRSDTTTCFYLYRFYATGKTSNGVHCYNTSTCDVCAFDAQDVSRPEKWTDLNDLSRGATIQGCSLCHAAGPAKAECVAFATAMGCTPAETAVLCP